MYFWNSKISDHRVATTPNQKTSALMVWPCKQNASGKAFKTSFTCESEREKKPSGTTTNTLGRMDGTAEDMDGTTLRKWMEPLGASTKRNVGGGSGPWCVAAQSRNPHGHERALKENISNYGIRFKLNYP